MRLIAALALLIPLAGCGPYVNPENPYQTRRQSFFTAARLGDVSTVDSYLAQGTNVNARDNTGATALHYGAGQGHLSIVQTLLAHGANPNSQDGLGKTPMMAAAEVGYRDIIEALRAAGAKDAESTRKPRAAAAAEEAPWWRGKE